jgi:hypothetical protein
MSLGDENASRADRLIARRHTSTIRTDTGDVHLADHKVVHSADKNKMDTAYYICFIDAGLMTEYSLIVARLADLSTHLSIHINGFMA